MTMTTNKEQTAVLESSPKNSETQSSPEFELDINHISNEATFECETSHYVLGYN